MSIAIVAGETTLTAWTAYEISISLLEPADAFDVTLGPVLRDVWEAVPLDALVRVEMRAEHGVSPLITGYIDERSREAEKGGGEIRIAGRCKIGRLIDESAALRSYADTTVLAAIRELAAPDFADIVVDNSANRDALRGSRASKAAAGREPLSLNALGGLVLDRKIGTLSARGNRRPPKKVEPGESRWEIIEALLAYDELIAWASADGRYLTIGRPNYRQESQYRLLQPARNSPLASQGNVLRLSYQESIAERYSEITVLGAVVGDRTVVGEGTTRLRETVVDTGASFRRPKRLIVADHEARSHVELRAAAEKLKRRQDSAGIQLTARVRGHTQTRSSAEAPALYAPDTMVDVYDEELDMRGRFLVAAVRYSGSREEQSTELTLVPEGAELAQ